MTQAATLSFEQGPIRPPSEAGSLLLRVTRNCPWNRCAFCSTYKRKEFSRRPLEEVIADIDNAKAIVDEIERISRQMGEGGKLTRTVLASVFHDPHLSDSFRSVALWKASGGETVFLQDANSIMLSTDSLLAIIHHLRKTFPEVKRITSYARAITLKGKSVEEYRRLLDAGLNRLHMGMESGSDQVLKLIDKGSKAAHIIEGGKKVVESGISLCVYVMPGIGGTHLSQDHVTQTARVINAVNPGHVRFRSLYVRRGSPLDKMVQEKRFVVPSEDDMVREIRDIVAALTCTNTRIVSDHVLNLLEEVEGTLPDDKDKILAVLDEYLNLPDDERLLFQLGRRGGGLRSTSDLRNPTVRTRLLEAKRQIEAQVPGGIAEYIQVLKKQFV